MVDHPHAPRCEASTRRGLRTIAKSSGAALRVGHHTRSDSGDAGAKCLDTRDARPRSRNRIAPLIPGESR